MSASSFRSPFAALLWKEWRESWWLLILMVVGPTALYIAGAALCASGVISDNTMISLPAFALWALASFLGAGLFAGEHAKGTCAFQLERPVARSAIWKAKLLLPAVALATGELLFFVVTDCVYPPLGWRWRPDTIVPFMFLVTGFLYFASAVLCSVMLQRPVTAWAAGGVLFFVTAVFVGGVFDHFDGGVSQTEISLNWILYLCTLTVEAVGMVWLSRVVYVRWKHD
jgi:hypothetical protein